MKYLILICFPAFFILSCKKEDRNNSTRKTYYEGTDKLMQSVDYKNGKKNGYFIEYYKNGKVLASQFYVNDTITDSSFEFHENGNMATSRIYKMGSREGVWKVFNKKGMMYIEKTYKNNSQDGPSNKYTYITGRPLERLNYKNGIKEGKQEYFYNNGKPKCSYIIKYNRLSELNEWSESGKKEDLDYRISVSEENHLLLKNEITLVVRLENPQPDDMVFEGEFTDSGMMIPLNIFKRIGDHFEFPWYIRKRDFVMKKLKIVCKRKTSMGNTIEKIVTYNFSANNY